MKNLLLILILLFFMVACGGTSANDIEPSADENDLTEETSEDQPDALTVIDEDDEATKPEANADELPRATITPPPVVEESGIESADDESYPAPPEPTAVSEGYQTLEIAPQRDPYPGPVIERLPQPDVEFATLDANIETAWVIISSGVQCDTDSPSYDDILEAIEVLSAENIDVYDGTTESRIVCAACGCPSGTFYRLNIGVDKLDTAVSLGFAEETP